MDQLQVRAFHTAGIEDNNKQPIIVVVKGEDHGGDRNHIREKKRPIIINQKLSIDKPIKLVNHPVFVESHDESESYEFQDLKRRKNHKNQNKDHTDKDHHYHYIPAPPPRRPVRPPVRPPIQHPKCDDLNPDKLVLKSHTDETAALVVDLILQAVSSIVPQ